MIQSSTRWSLVATPERIEEERERLRAEGCICDCALVTDAARIRAAGGDPDDPEIIVFNHPWECPIARIRMAPYN